MTKKTTVSKKESGERSLEELNRIVDAIHAMGNDEVRADLEKKAGKKLYNAEEMGDQFNIDSIQRPYYYGHHKKSGQPVTMMKFQTKPEELFMVERTGREAMRRGKDRYTRKENLQPGKPHKETRGR